MLLFDGFPGSLVDSNGGIIILATENCVEYFAEIVQA